MGEAPRGSFEEFKRAVLAGSRLNVAQLARGIVTLTTSDGATLKLTHNARNKLPGVERNGAAVDWSKWRAGYAAGSIGEAPMRQDWLGGELRVQAGGWTFTSRVGADGRLTFHESRR